MNVEICCADVDSIYAAKRGGATRVELCAGISEGGLTPPLSMVEIAKELEFPEINVLIRPRSGDFVFNDKEVRAMCWDAGSYILSGATGLVVGALTPEGDVDEMVVKELLRFSRTTARSVGKTLSFTFHRAIDLCRDWRKAFDFIISCGFDCVLTSGQASSAADGVGTLREMVDYAGGRLKIMAGCGVNVSNADKIISTGVDLIHSTARRPIESRMIFRCEDVSMGNPGADEYARLATSPELVANLIVIANKTNK